jgi:hypothetical protein
LTLVHDNQQTQGIVTGTVLAVAWCFLLTNLEMIVFYHQNVFLNPVLAWINLGPIPLFIAVGTYYFRKSVLIGEEHLQEFAAIKGMIVALFLWLIVILFIQTQQIANEGSIYPTIAGYLLMIVMMAVFQGKSRSSEPNKS